MKEPKDVKVWHIATSFPMPATEQGIREAHQNALNQLIGHFFTLDVQIESTSVATLDGGQHRPPFVVVTIIGFKMYGKEELAEIRKADALYAIEKATRDKATAAAI